MLAPGDLLLMITWRDADAAAAFEHDAALPPQARLRRVRVVREYGLFDRREAPQFHPDAAGGPTRHD